MPLDPKRVSLEEFKAVSLESVTGGKPCADGAVLLAKGIASEAKAVEGDASVREFVASTGDVDRDQDTIDQAGWDLSDFSKSGVFLWAHDRSLLPIGDPVATWIENNTLRTRVKFTPADMPHQFGVGFGHAVGRMFDEHFLKGVSVGFIPHEWQFNESRGGMAMDFKRQSLMEISAVPVPSNPNAIAMARAKGIDTAPILAWAETVRDAKSGLYIPRDAIASLLDQSAGEKTISIPAPAAKPEPATTVPTAHAPEGAPAPEAKTEESPAAVVKSPDPIPAPAVVEPDPCAYDKAMAAAEVAEAGIVAAIKGAIGVIAKAGRVLSKKNEDDLRSASDLILAVLEQVNPPDDDKAAKSAPDAAKGITAEDLAAIVTAEVDAQLSKITGRLPR